MKHVWGTLLIAGIVIALSGCGSSLTVNKDGVHGDAGSYQYDLTENDCATGKHSFDNKDAYCQGLRSSSLNKGCAYDLRKSEYEQNCGGSFTETN